MTTIKTVSFDEAFAERFTNISSWHCCLLLGGSMGSNEYLFLPVEIPPIDDTESSPKAVHSIRDVDVNWVAQHSKNLNRMAPGGVHISGVCFTTTSSEFNASQDYVKKILLSIRKKEHIFGSLKMTESGEKIVMLVDLQTKKFTCKVFDTDSEKSQFRSVATKQCDEHNQWVSFKTFVCLSIKTFLPTDRKRDKILKHLQAAVDPYLQSLLTETSLLVNKVTYGLEEAVLPGILGSSSTAGLIFAPVKKSKGGTGMRQKKKRQMPSEIVTSGVDDADEEDTDGTRNIQEINTADSRRTSQKTSSTTGDWAAVDLAIFGPHFPEWHRVGSSSSLDSGCSSDSGTKSDSSPSDIVPINRLVINGRIPGIAFLPRDVSVGTLLEAFRRDLSQSILARLQLLTDELHITGGDLEVPRMSLPQRVLVRLPACPDLPLSDYKFLSETADDVVARLHYFCLPVGATMEANVAGTSASQHIFGQASAVAPSDSARGGSLGDEGTGGFSTSSSPLLFRKGDCIDASCLDTSLEKSPEGSAEELSDPETLIDDVTKMVQTSGWNGTLTSPGRMLVIAGFLPLLVILLPYVLSLWSSTD